MRWHGVIIEIGLRLLAIKYLMISPYQVELIGYSTDQDKLLYKNGDTYGIFTFDPDVANPIEDLGSKVIENISSHQRIAWVYDHKCRPSLRPFSP